MPTSPNPSPPQRPIAPEREHLTGQLQVPTSLVTEVHSGVQNITQLQELLEQAQRVGVTRLFETLLIGTLALDASDIHIEPENDSTQIRLRIDGLLHDLVEIQRPIYEELVSRIKLVSKTKLNVADKPQDGRFSFDLGEQGLIEARVATLPAEYGESIVIRVLNPKNLITIEQLGLRPELLTTLKEQLKKPNGMIVATGPTGCGKTTTLYAFLKEIAKPEIKLVTIEDPIEYHLDGVSQTQVNPEKGYDFASGLEAIVRQDPDVILVGEIRDQATAQIALQAALTGHLVFSTLHTNDAPGTISRLVSLKAKRVNIGAASNVIIGQRLVRKVCSQCTILEKATPAQIALIKKGIQGMPGATAPQTLSIPKAQGCEICNATGYKGRVGVFEMILVNSAMEEFILTKPSTSALRAFAIQQGMTTMYQDGLIKVMQGITTLEELARITGEKTK